MYTRKKTTIDTFISLFKYFNMSINMSINILQGDILTNVTSFVSNTYIIIGRVSKEWKDSTLGNTTTNVSNCLLNINLFMYAFENGLRRENMKRFIVN